jgi:hypothetical protein
MVVSHGHAYRRLWAAAVLTSAPLRVMSCPPVGRRVGRRWQSWWPHSHRSRLGPSRSSCARASAACDPDARRPWAWGRVSGPTPRATDGPSLTLSPLDKAANASARARSRSWVACWYLRAAAGLACPALLISSAVVAPVAAAQVSPECLRSCSRKSGRPTLSRALVHARSRVLGATGWPLAPGNSQAVDSGATCSARWSTRTGSTLAGIAIVRTPASVFGRPIAFLPSICTTNPLRT